MFFAFLLAGAFSATYAVLFAGSDTWKNYRHQADIHTMHKKLLENGIPEANIKVMCFDDIAGSSSNPFKGQIFHTIDHAENVYLGTSALAYSGQQVNERAFYNTLRDLPITSEDYLFIYYNNHGGPGILGVPEQSGGVIWGDELAQVLNQIQGKYKKALFGIEACYSGSIGELITAKNMAIITAANNHESSYADVWDGKLGTFLSNEFTNYWLNEMFDNPEETVGNLFNNVQGSTTGSHVCFYGDESVKELTIDTFFGKAPHRRMRRMAAQKIQGVTPRIATAMTFQRHLASKSFEERKQAREAMKKMEQLRNKLDDFLDELVNRLEGSSNDMDSVMEESEIKVTQGYFKVLRYFISKFGQINPDDYDRFMIIKNLCARHAPDFIIDVMDKITL